MYTDTSNDFSINNNARHNYDEMEPFEFGELLSHQTLNSASRSLHSGE